MENNNETKSKNGAGKKVIPVFFSTVPNILIQTKGLERIERQLAILFYSFIPLGGCRWSKEALKVYCDCGPYHLERAIKRLVHRKMIEVVQGGWKQNTNEKRREHNRYIFEKDPYKWAVTEEMQEEIVRQTEALKMEIGTFEHKPYQNDYSFEQTFKERYKHLAEGRKGRKRGKTDWRMKTLELTSKPLSFFELARLYLENYDDIQIANSSKKMKKNESTYFKTIYFLFREIVNSELEGNDLVDLAFFNEAVSIYDENAEAILKYMIEKKNAG